MADTPQALPRISVGRWKGEGPHPGAGPVFWRCNRCNRCGEQGVGCKNDGEAYKDAAAHECAEPLPAPGDPG